jgi:hypothetical protein
MQILPDVLHLKSISYKDKIIGDHQCGFPRNRLTSDQIFCTYQILEKKSEYNGIAHHLFLGFKKAYDTVMREELYNCNILIEIGIPMKAVKVIKICF